LPLDTQGKDNWIFIVCALSEAMKRMLGTLQERRYGNNPLRLGNNELRFHN